MSMSRDTNSHPVLDLVASIVDQCDLAHLLLAVQWHLAAGVEATPDFRPYSISINPEVVTVQGHGRLKTPKSVRVSEGVRYEETELAIGAARVVFVATSRVDQ